MRKQSIYLGLVLLLLSVGSLAWSTNSFKSPSHLSPSTIFTNKFWVLDENLTEAAKNHIKQVVASSKGAIDIIPFAYPESSLKRAVLEDYFSLEETAKLDLLQKHISSSPAAPFLFVNETKVAEAQSWLQKNFRHRSFVIIPCRDDFSKIPLIEDPYSRFMYWEDLGKLLQDLAVRQIKGIGDEAIKYISKNIAPYNFTKQEMSFLKLIASYGELTPEDENFLAGRKECLSLLARRESISDNGITGIIRSNNVKAIVDLCLNLKLNQARFKELLIQELSEIKPTLISSIIGRLPHDFSLGKELFHIFCENLETINQGAEYKIRAFEPIEASGDFELEEQVSYIEFLYKKDFKTWEKIFSEEESTSRQPEKVFKRLALTSPLLCRDILRRLARYNISSAKHLYEILYRGNTVKREDILLKIIQLDSNLDKLGPIVLNDAIPELIRANVVFNALSGNRFISRETYIAEIVTVFADEKLLMLLKGQEVELDSSLYHWLSLITTFPYVASDMELEVDNLPTAYRENLHQFISLDRNRVFLAKYDELLVNIKQAGTFEDFLPGTTNLYNLIEILNNTLVLPTADNISVFDTAQRALNNDKETGFNIIDDLDRFHQEYPSLPLAAILPLLTVNDPELFGICNSIYSWKEVAGYQLRSFRISSFLCNKNFADFSKAFKYLFEQFVVHQDSKNTRKRLGKVIDILALFLNFPQESRMNEFLEGGITRLVKEYETESEGLSLGRYLEGALKLLFMEALQHNWDINIREDLKEDVLYERLYEIQDFWLYYNSWNEEVDSSISYGEMERANDIQERINILKIAVEQYLNYGSDIKNLKYGGTPASKKQLEVMEALLKTLISDAQEVKRHLANYIKDTDETIVLPNGKVIHAYSSDSLEFWLKRGYYGGGTCANPHSMIGYTQCVNGVTFSAMSKRIVLSPTPYGKEALVSESRSITEIEGRLVPILLDEHIYMVNEFPQGIIKDDIAEATIINALRSASQYGYKHIFLADGTKEPSGFSWRLLRNLEGYVTTNEFIDEEGNIVKEEIRVKSITPLKEREFYVLEEHNRWKYTDNALFLFTKEGLRAATDQEVNSIDFHYYAWEGEIAGVKCRFAKNVLRGNLLEIERRVVSKQKISLEHRIRQMYPELDLDSKELVTKMLQIVERLEAESLVLVGDRNIQEEQQKNQETTLTLINQMVDMSLATDKYLSKAYTIAERIGKYISVDLKEWLHAQDNRKTLVGIPRGGIPILSKIKRVWRGAGVINTEASVVDVSRNIINGHQYVHDDAVILCDQVINTGTTMDRTMEYLLTRNADLKFIIVSITADPDAMLRLYRKYPQIQKIYIGDLRRRVVIKEGVTSTIGHPGERSYADKFDALFKTGAQVTIRNKIYTVESPLEFDRHFRSFFLVHNETGKRYRLKIMVSEEEGLIAESMAALAREERFAGGIPRDVSFYSEEGFLISEAISETNFITELRNIIADKQNFAENIQVLLKDILEVILFLKEQDRLFVNIRPEALLFNKLQKRWYVTDFHNEENPGAVFSEKQIIQQIGVLLNFIISESNQHKVALSPPLYGLLSKIEQGLVRDISSLQIALDPIIFKKSKEEYILTAA